MRRRFGTRLAIVVPLLALVTTACAGDAVSTPPAATQGSGSSPSASGSEPDAPTAEVVRVLAVAGPETDALIAHAPEFEEATGITASIEQVARPLWGQRKVRELIEDAGLYDVVMVGGGDDNTWVKYKGHVVDLSQLLPAEELDQILLRDRFEIDGRLIGVPQYYNFPMLFYRKDLLEDPDEQAAFEAEHGRELAIPTTYEEMYEVAEFFHRPPELYGFFIGGVDWSIFLDHTYFTYGLGGNYGDLDSGELTLDSPEQKEAMDWLVKFTEFNPPGWETQSFFDGDQLVQNGQVAMYQNWFYVWKTFQETVPDQIGMAPLVGEGAHLGAFVATVPEAAPNPDAGVAFIEWMMGAEYQKSQAVETGNLPIRDDVLQDAELREGLVGIEQLEAVLPTLQYNHTTWAGELSAGVSEAILKVIDGEFTSEEAADWLQNEKFAGRKAIE